MPSSYTYWRGLSRRCSFRLLWAMRRPRSMGRVTGTDSRAFSFLYAFIILSFNEPSGSGICGQNKTNRRMRKVEFVENETNYVAPLVEMIEIEVEKGFSSSGGSGSLDDEYIDGENTIV